MGKRKTTHTHLKMVNGKGKDTQKLLTTRVETKKDYSHMNVDDFMSVGIDGSNDDDDDEEEIIGENGFDSHVGDKEFPIPPTDMEEPEQNDHSSSDEEADDENDEDDEADNDNDTEEDDDVAENEDDVAEDNHDDNGDENGVKGNHDNLTDTREVTEDIDGFSVSDHKKSLNNLRNTDPEFYQFLEENDKKLLQFNVSDSDSENEEKFHKPADDLEVGSDQSDFEDENQLDSEKDGRVISLKMLREWEEKIQTDKTVATIGDLINGFHAALNRVTANEEDCKYKVDGSAVFNGVVQLCVMHLQPAAVRFLRISGDNAKNVQPSRCKKWNKVKFLLKSYFIDLLKLMSGVSSAHIVTVLLKHLHQMSPLLVCFPKILIKLSKQLISIWGSADDTSRILAFLCILRIITSQHHMLSSVLKLMYLTYVRNVKFTSVSSLPSINFMRRSLVELFCVDEAISYQQMFLYVRQLAIHLRNAVTLRKRDAVQSVLNWQFVHSLHLWLDVLGADKPTLRPLLYPVVQVTLGTVKLIPTTQYYPLRLHCVRMLLTLQERTGTFVPVLPLLMEVLTGLDVNKRATAVSMKPMDLSCILRVSKPEQHEKSFKDALVEAVFLHTLQAAANQAHTIGYPDLVRPTVLQLRKFLKTCKVGNYCKKIRSLVDKMEENARLVEARRKSFTASLKERKAVDAWETTLQTEQLPLVTFYRGLQVINTRVAAKAATDNDKLADFGIPTMKKRTKAARDGPQEPVVLFPSDSDSDLGSDRSESRSKPTKKKRKLPPTKNTKPKQLDLQATKEEDQPDVLENLNMADF